MPKLSQRNQRVIELLKKIIKSLHRLAEEAELDTTKDIYMAEARTIYSCIWLLTDNKYLKSLEGIYK